MNKGNIEVIKLSEKEFLRSLVDPSTLNPRV